MSDIALHIDCAACAATGSSTAVHIGFTADHHLQVWCPLHREVLRVTVDWDANPELAALVARGCTVDGCAKC